MSPERMLGAMGRRNSPGERKKIEECLAVLQHIRLHVHATPRRGRRSGFVDGPVIHKTPYTAGITGGRVDNWYVIHPILYYAVRRYMADGTTPKPGRLGTNFFPVPVDVARISTKSFPLAHAILGTQSWRLKHAADRGESSVRISIKTVLDDIGIGWASKQMQINPGRTLSAVEANFDELKRCGAFDWGGVDGRRSVDGMIEMILPQHASDRLIHGVRPEENRALADAPRTYDALFEWKAKMGLTDSQLAERLGVSRRALQKFKKRGGRLLSDSARGRLT